MKRILTLAVLLGAALAIQACKGKLGDAGPAGPAGTAPPAPLCANPTQRGTTLTTNSRDSYPEEIEATSVVLASDTTAISLSMYASSGAVTGQVRMGIYNDTGSVAPNHLIIESAPFTLVPSSWNTVDIPDVYLPAGTYWLSYQNSNSYPNADTWVPGGGNYYYSTGTLPWAALPDAFPPGVGNSNRLSVVMNTCP